MRKLIALFAIVAFMGITAAPAFSMVNDNVVITVNNDEKPKKKEKTEAKKEGECSKSCEKSCEKEGAGDKKKK